MARQIYASKLAGLRGNWGAVMGVGIDRVGRVERFWVGERFSRVEYKEA